ncbi:MAG: GNAT family N-acetyltransferase [Sedimentisphaerales bacterium]
MAYKIVETQERHIDRIVDVHIKAFPNFFQTFLGPRFLKESYKSYIYDKTCINFVAEDDQTHDVLGFIAGPLMPAGYFKKLFKKRWYAFCLAGIVAVLKRPMIIKRLFRAMFFRGNAPPGLQRALLGSIAVSPMAQGQGVGKALVERWVEEVWCRGGTGCYLTTDAENNEKVNRFYQKLGWKIESTYTTPEGRVMNRYILDMPQNAKSNQK